MRELVEERKRRVDEEFGRKLNENFSENKKLFWKEVRRVRGGERGGGVRMRGEDGELVRGENNLKGLWKDYFEQLFFFCLYLRMQLKGKKRGRKKSPLLAAPLTHKRRKK